MDTKTILFHLAEDAFEVMNWARREGMKKDKQLAQVVAAFEKDADRYENDNNGRAVGETGATMTPLWMWEEQAQSEWFGHVQIFGVWAYYRLNWPWM